MSKEKKITLNHRGEVHKDQRQEWENKLGKFIKYFREKNEFSLKEVVDKFEFNISREAISKYEHASSGIGLDKLFEIMRVLNIKPQYLELLGYSHLPSKLKKNNISMKQLKVLIELVKENTSLTNFKKRYIEKVNEHNQHTKYYIEDKKTEINIRSGHTQFAERIKENYNYECAICGINTKEILICSHIIPWSKDKEKRIDESNAICLCALHDKLFDKGYITINNNYEIKLSSLIKKDKKLYKILREIKGETIKKPSKGKPNKDYLKYHRDNIFKN
ncbi:MULTISPECIES: HNH endonuclease [unclassified Candidatus Frackibacter]|uniref:HNH endonuclease n=1 Tax=unclassified Candidatus Frackibacter TaxID=2648818 RepID=UPI000887A682|nr:MULTISPECIES: HNH endonuclease [unclassified Candidatus Frackibacter]SDC76341.1 Helix-turn-helix [Candidatus Frackibacter sp. WG11]SEM89789.1 Helix-turn-helix [Candidatus Frackibacter sp. WG12]SFL99274.1 Helix-turn-helix [Candidatus Frackibacter sp. WG13]